jgi:hypothetical protein
MCALIFETCALICEISALFCETCAVFIEICALIYEICALFSATHCSTCIIPGKVEQNVIEKLRFL